MPRRTPEGLIKDEIKDGLTDAGAWWCCPFMNGFGRKGIPDIICCYRGQFLAIEVKVPGGEPTAWQHRELNGIRAAYGEAMVATSWREVYYKLLEIDKELDA
jgi:Holliday junction resolvase